MYTTTQLAAKFHITDQSVKRYAKEFRTYLSPTATPEKGDTRLFTDDDLKVYDLIVRMSIIEHKKLEQIHIALERGERGSVPDMSANGLAPTPTDTELRMMSRIADLEAEVKELRDTAVENRLLKQQLADKEATIAQLNREIGRLEAKG